MNYTLEEIENILTKLVVDSITTSYDLQEYEATKIIKGSSFYEMLKEDPEFIGHYPPKYWADYIIEENGMIK